MERPTLNSIGSGPEAWTAIVPLKAEGQRKTRLADHLSAAERSRLSRQLFEHVAGVLNRTPAIAQVMVLSAHPPAGWRGSWAADHGRGLNQELAIARAAIGAAPLLIIHADLPLLTSADVGVLLEAAQRSGLSVAPDRHGTGTNALAVHDGRPFAFSFGPDSFRRHRAHGEAAIVDRPGLALDVDTPGDLDDAIAGGFAPQYAHEGELSG